MKSRVSTLVLAGIVAACSLSMLSLEEVAAQTKTRGMRVQQGSQTDRRVALVIGNSAYKDSPLLNPVNDARAMAHTLRNLRFEVLYGENLSQNDIKRNIRAFGEKIRNGGVGLFYYAGHGIQIRGTNYLIPVGSTILSEEEVEYESVDVGLVLAQMAAARNQLNIVILDACRNNPFARSFRSAQKGLASIDAPSGTLLAYATAPGSVASDGEGENGLYTQELLKNMRVPGVSIEQVFKQVRIGVQDKTQGKQVPWESSSLVGDFYFSVVGSVSVTVNNDPKVDPAAIELSYWETIKNSTDAEDFKSYLAKYPDGQFADLARRRAGAQASGTKSGDAKQSGLGDIGSLNRELRHRQMELTVSGSSGLDPSSNRVGDRFIATIVGPAKYKGADIIGRVAKINLAGGASGRAELTLLFDEIVFADETRGRITEELEAIVEGAIASGSNLVIRPKRIGAPILGPDRDGWTFNAQMGTTLTYYGCPSAATCRADCENNPKCMAFSWVKPAGYQPGDPPVCYLLSSWTGLVKHSCCISAVKL
ncbi:MAG: caspase family protein [Blastocatellia bacterium]